jgi:hypothetical protein
MVEEEKLNFGKEHHKNTIEEEMMVRNVQRWVTKKKKSSLFDIHKTPPLVIIGEGESPNKKPNSRGGVLNTMLDPFIFGGEIISNLVPLTFTPFPIKRLVFGS